MELKTDPQRQGPKMHGATGIYIRARGTEPDGKLTGWDSFDIAELDRASLHEFLRSRGGENLWAENCVLTLLGHEQITQS